MNYTENYRLNQWNPEDRILREDFNRDNANVEGGLTKLQQGLEQEAKDREAAVTAAKQEATQAVTAAKGEMSEELSAAIGELEGSKADKTALAQLQTLVNAMPFVKLREVSVGTAVNQVDVDVRDIEWEKYAYVLFVPRLLVSQATNIGVRMNGLSNGAYDGDNPGQYYLHQFKGHVASDQCSTAVELRVAEQNGGITTSLLYSNYKGNAEVLGSSPRPGYVTASNLETLNFYAYDDALLQAGGKISIYGVKM